MIAFLTLPDDDRERLHFEHIYDTYHRLALRLAYDILKEQSDAEDAVQETFLAILKHIGTLSEMQESVLKAYVITATKNKAISILRKRNKESEKLCDIDSVEIADEKDLFALAEENGTEAVLACIRELSEKQRDVLILYYFYHHSVREIAKAFGISESVAMSRFSHGREKLIKLLKRRGYHG